MRNLESVTTRVDLIRHGEPQGGRMFRGATDHPLSEEGWSQMRHAVNEQSPWDVIITSPLLRCSEFAHELGTQHNIPVIEVKSFAELYLGDWEGLTYPEARALSDDGHSIDDVTAFWMNPDLNAIPNGETLEAFDHRVDEAWRELIETYPGQHILVVAHLFTCNLILRQVIQQPLNNALLFDIPYAGLSRIRIDDSQNGRLTQVEWVCLTQLP